MALRFSGMLSQTVVCLPIDILAAHVYSFTCVTTSTGWNHTAWGKVGGRFADAVGCCSSSPLGRSLCTSMSTVIGKEEARFPLPTSVIVKLMNRAGIELNAKVSALSSDCQVVG